MTTPGSTSAVALRASVTSVTFENTSTAALANVPVTFFQPMEKGALPADGAEVELRAPDGSVIPCQLDVRVTRYDGSVQHAGFSTVLPALAGAAAVTYEIVRAAPGAAPSPATPADFPGLESVVTITQNGQVYTVALAALLAGPKITWLSGDVVSEFEVYGNPTTAGGVEHEHLHVRFLAKLYKGQHKARVEATIENCWAWNPAPQDITYDISITVGGVQVYAASSLVHHPFARFREVFWWNYAEPPVHIRHDIAYLSDTCATPKYDPTILPNLAQATKFKANTIANGGPMGCGTAQKVMSTTGGRSDIGILPGWDALYLISMDPAAKAATLKQGELSGSWGTHYRDKNTGRILSFIEWPNFSTSGPASDNVNPATGRSERAPAHVTNTNPNHADISHCPQQAYVAYLVTGEIYYLEEIQFWAQAMLIGQMSHSTYRNGAEGLIFQEQLRGQAWALRSLGQAAYISPPGKEKAEFTRILKNNISWYDKRYTNNPGPEAELGIIHHGWYSLNYTAVAGKGVTGLANWQADHFTAAIGCLVELGFEFARPLFYYTAKYTVGRLYGQPGVSWIQAAAFVARVRDTADSPIYTTHKQVFDNTMSPAVIAAAQGENCATQEMADAWAGFNAWAAANGRGGSYMDGVSNPAIGDMDGYSDGDAGYPSCLQQAVAYCATHGAKDGLEAWKVFMGRAVKPNYVSSPQLALVPRIAAAVVPKVEPAPASPVAPIPITPPVPAAGKGTVLITSPALVGRKALRVNVFDPERLGVAFTSTNRTATAAGAISITGAPLVRGKKYAVLVTDSTAQWVAAAFPLLAV